MLEKDLYEPVRNYLELRFRDGLTPPFGQLLGFPAITATAGGPGTGTWSKPDLCFVALWRYRYSPHWQLDLHGFEVKTQSGCNTESVHESLNHTSHVHFANLLWHNPNWDDTDPRCKEILDRCRRFGVGLITLASPKDASTYHIHLTVPRHEPSGDAVDDFIETRIPDEEKVNLMTWLAAGR